MNSVTSVVATKTFQTTVLATLLFYLLGNPDTYKMVCKIPGLKFVMKGTNQITHSGVMTHALVFGLLFFLCVLLINHTLKQQLTFLNVVENYGNRKRLNNRAPKRSVRKSQQKKR